MKVVVVGAGGQLGRELLRHPWGDDVVIVSRTSADLDITDRPAVLEFVKQVDPDVVINAAAYTAVDRAEEDEGRATEVNGTAVGYLAAAADTAKALLIHISTDYVFDGAKSEWYTEDDEPYPISAYGRSKLAGEQNAALAKRSVTLRTSWIYGALGSNFVATMLRLASERDELNVVADQLGCPTSAADLATVIAETMSFVAVNGGVLKRQLYHVAAPDSASWHEVAMETLQLSSKNFDGVCRAISTEDYPTQAVRPANSRLDSSCFRKELGIALPPWRTSLARVVAELESSVPTR